MDREGLSLYRLSTFCLMRGIIVDGRREIDGGRSCLPGLWFGTCPCVLSPCSLAVFFVRRIISPGDRSWIIVGVVAVSCLS